MIHVKCLVHRVPAIAKRTALCGCGPALQGPAGLGTAGRNANGDGWVTLGLAGSGCGEREKGKDAPDFTWGCLVVNFTSRGAAHGRGLGVSFFNVSKAGLVTALLCTQYPQDWAPIWVSHVLRHPEFWGVVAASHLPPNPPSPPGQLKCCLGGTHSHHFVLEPSKRGLLTGHLLFFSNPSPEGRPDYGGQGWAPGSTGVRGPPDANSGCGLSKGL